MDWPDVRDLWDYWQRSPPLHVSLHHLAVRWGCMPPPSNEPLPEASSEDELAAFDRAVNGE